MKKLLKIFIFLIVVISPIFINFNFFSGENIVQIANAEALSLDCKPGPTGFSDFGCQTKEAILSVYEVLIFSITQIFVVLSGFILDTFVFFSIDSGFYKSGVIEAGWEILRDFTNIVFILALLISAFQMVLGINESNTKRKIIHTIIIALVINFSLFITYAIIDASNIFAHVFYNRIEVTSDQYNAQLSVDSVPTTNTSIVSDSLGNLIKGEGGRSVSLAIASLINPQKIISAGGGGTDIGFFQGLIIITSAGLLNILLIWIFLSISLLFLGRILGLMIYGILAPLAFTSILIPGLENNKYIGFKNWMSQVFSLAFMAPVFMFFIYLTVTFVTSKGILASIQSAGEQDFIKTILNTYLLFFMIGGMLWYTKKITTVMAGEIGGMINLSVIALKGN